MVAPGFILLLLIPLGGVALLFWLGLRVFGRSWKGILLSLFVVLAAVFLLPLWAGAWLPDVFSGRTYTLAVTKLADGSDFRIVQYWGGDFYTTELWITFPDGRRECQVLDGDDSKSWHLPMAVDPASRTVSVTLSGNRPKTIKW
jgi:hypothetical protein